MLPNDSSSNVTSCQQEADACLREGNYAKAATLYEQAINTDPNHKSNYWHLGLILLLQGKEEEAQTTWLLGMADGEAEEVELWTEELIKVLATEANRQATTEDYSVAWAIRQHIREIHPTDINNLLHLIYLSIALENYTAEQLTEYEIITQLENSKIEELDQDLLLHLLNKLLIYDPINLSSIEFVSVAVQKIEDKPALVSCLIPPIYQIAYSFAELGVARKYTEILLNVVPENQEVLRTMAQFSTELTEYSLGLEYAEKSYALSKKIFEKVIDYHQVCRSLIALKGCDQKVKQAVEHQENLLKSLVAEAPEKLAGAATRLYSSSFFFPYTRDCAEKNIKIRSQVAELCQQNLEKANSQQINKYRQKLSRQKQINSTKKTLKIGYLSHCLRRHSVGWIARWLFTYHNREKFEIYAYLQGAENRNDSLQQWYINQATKAHVYGIVSTEVAEDIYEDEIDILIDLDSTTLTNSCSIMAMKAAPINLSICLVIGVKLHT
ncbi:MAG: tetratricopeptide repeat protein [Okeania sp. SIO1H6]|nr:tetratricopeptide repeat protein [Okeania sp. SIO1H6]